MLTNNHKNKIQNQKSAFMTFHNKMSNYQTYIKNKSWTKERVFDLRKKNSKICEHSWDIQFQNQSNCVVTQ